MIKQALQNKKIDRENLMKYNVLIKEVRYE